MKATDNENGKYNRFEKIIFKCRRVGRSDGRAQSRFRAASLGTPVSQRTGSRRYGKPILPLVHLSFHFQACIRHSGALGVRHFLDEKVVLTGNMATIATPLRRRRQGRSIRRRRPIAFHYGNCITDSSGWRWVLGINSLDDFCGRNIRTRN